MGRISPQLLIFSADGIKLADHPLGWEVCSGWKYEEWQHPLLPLGHTFTQIQGQLFHVHSSLQCSCQQWSVCLLCCYVSNEDPQILYFFLDGNPEGPQDAF